MAVVFLDTETTRKDRGYRPWEIAMIRRERDGSQRSITLFVHQDDLDLANADPVSLSIGRFEQRHPGFGIPLQKGQIHLRAADAAPLVRQWTHGASVWAVNASFDTIGLDAMLARHNLRPAWYYVPQDIAGIAYGFQLGNGGPAPRSSETLSRACGVEPPGPNERHTAMGDAEWVSRWYDKLHEYSPSGAL